MTEMIAAPETFRQGRVLVGVSSRVIEEVVGDIAIKQWLTLWKRECTLECTFTWILVLCTFLDDWVDPGFTEKGLCNTSRT